MKTTDQDFGKIEYRVKPITRYVITRYEENERGSACETRGEYDNPDVAWEVGYALCKMEHERFGYAPGDERIQYPRHPNEANAVQVRPTDSVIVGNIIT